MSIDDYATIALAVLDRLPIHRIRPDMILGHSLGGVVIQRMQQRLIDCETSLRRTYGIKRALLVAALAQQDVWPNFFGGLQELTTGFELCFSGPGPPGCEFFDQAFGDADEDVDWTDFTLFWESVGLGFLMLDNDPLTGDYSAARGVNEVGHVVGQAALPDGNRHAALWHDNQVIDLGTLGGAESDANAINDDGQVAGHMTTWTSTQALIWAAGQSTRPTTTPKASRLTPATLIIFGSSTVAETEYSNTVERPTARRAANRLMRSSFSPVGTRTREGSRIHRPLAPRPRRRISRSRQSRLRIPWRHIENPESVREIRARE